MKKRKIIFIVLASLLLLFVGFVTYFFGPCKDTVQESFTFHTLDAGKIVANVSVKYNSTPRIVYRSEENRLYFQDVMKWKIRKVIYDNFYEDVLNTKYIDVKNHKNELSSIINNHLGYIHFEYYEPLWRGNPGEEINIEEIDIFELDPPKSCWFDVKSATCEFVLDSMVKEYIIELQKLQEEREKRKIELDNAKKILKQIKESDYNLKDSLMSQVVKQLETGVYEAPLSGESGYIPQTTYKNITYSVEYEIIQ